VVSAALSEIDCESLWAKIERGDPFVLVDALAPIAFAGAHLPGAVNIPPPSVDALARRRIPDLETEIVVYCAGPDCDSSVEVAERLVAVVWAGIVASGETAAAPGVQRS